VSISSRSVDGDDVHVNDVMSVSYEDLCEGGNDEGSTEEYQGGVEAEYLPYVLVQVLAQDVH
jgi:hypothetical protein